MLARAAENLYWMARYLERAENTARFINSSTHVLLDLPPGAAFGWANLVEIAGLDSSFHQFYPVANEDAIMRFLIEDTRNPSSIISCVRYARENTRTLRELLPAEMWERINSLHLYLRDHAHAACDNRRERYQVLNYVIEQRHAIVGLVSGTMAHDIPYQIMRLGRNVERADMTSRMLDLNSAVHLPQDNALHESITERIWMSLLNSLSAYQSYRRLVSMQVRSEAVIQFLLCDARFPRSITYCLAEVTSCLALLPRSQPLQPLVEQLYGQLGCAENLDAANLRDKLEQIQQALADFHNALTQHYFRAN
ncbi:MAG: alpha-E domain-containing protein [Gallionella sp.]|nr:alpha-E domain-containing protein [Gallionella sp.]